MELPGRPRHFQVQTPICLRACYAMPGTETEHHSMVFLSIIDRADGAISLCSRYAMSGTDLEYGASESAAQYRLRTAVENAIKAVERS
eukprot:2848179-Rhodomonas_salina.5